MRQCCSVEWTSFHQCNFRLCNDGKGREVKFQFTRLPQEMTTLDVFGVTSWRRRGKTAGRGVGASVTMCMPPYRCVDWMFTLLSRTVLAWWS